jgi:peptidoglycan/LPS O-acetylase OafA/YrhL
MSLGGNEAVYAGHADSNVIQEPVAERENAGVFLGNALFLETIAVPTLGTNGPLWSLSNEFWYYMLFPCCCLLLWNDRRTWYRLFYALPLVPLCAYAWHIAAYFPVWLMGFGLTLVPSLGLLRYGVVNALATVLSIAFFCAALAISKLGRVSDVAADYLIGLTFTLVLYVVLHKETISKEGLYARVAAFFANSSYTLYLTHLPVLVLLCAFLVGSSRWQFGPRAVLMVGGLCGLVFLYSYLISLLTEVRTDGIRQRMSRRFGGPRKEIKRASDEQMEECEPRRDKLELVVKQD